LRDFRSDLDHEKFVSAVIHSFSERFGVEENAVVVDEATMRENDYITSGVEELLVRPPPSHGRSFQREADSVKQTWEWKYGQTLDFRHIMTKEFGEGILVCRSPFLYLLLNITEGIDVP
jgi:hypothetical protein